ncbi:MAG: class I SAM-dependent methyltransferase [Flavobacteriaceae bacterium]|nr:class I SAM-dependent methyltransferase [Flavobacteriaceae bacterium]
MKDKEFWLDDNITIHNQQTNKKAITNRFKTIDLINAIGGLHGNVLDIGTRNVLTVDLEMVYNIKIDSTHGDLDEVFNCPHKNYDFVHYGNVIEHQFNPLFTLQKIRTVLQKDGILILATPLKPKWITTAKCHFHEFDEYSYSKLIKRAGFKEVKRLHYYREFSLKGIRQFLGSFYKRQVISVLIKS